MLVRVNLPDKLAKANGLAPADLRGLGPAVALIGPHGGGKSRFFDALAELWRRRERARVELPELRDRLERQGDEAPAVLGARIATLQADLDRLELVLNATTLHRPTPLIRLRASVALEPAPLDLPMHERWALLERVADADFEAAARARAVFLWDLARRAGLARQGQTERDAQVLAELRAFDELCRTLLGKPFQLRSPRRPDGPVRPGLAGRRYEDEWLSEAERVLLSWAVLLHRQRGRLEDAIVLLDAPENGLHPSAARTLIDQLRAFKPAQLWVATHSLSVVASLGADAVWELREGTIQRPGVALWERLLDLDGGPRAHRDVDQLRRDADALRLASAIVGMLRDPESYLLDRLEQLVSARREAGAPVRVLDLGVSRAPLAHALLDAPIAVKYHALPLPETDPEDLAIARARVRTLRGTLGEPWFPAASADAPGEADVAVLAGLIRHVPPQHWLDLLRAAARQLAPGGIVLVVEPPSRAGGRGSEDLGASGLAGHLLDDLLAGDSWLPSSSMDARIFEATAEQVEALSKEAWVEILEAHRERYAEAVFAAPGARSALPWDRRLRQEAFNRRSSAASFGALVAALANLSEAGEE
ncbi:MAG: AAA family ATPase [Alphaproteobacteria bacterium]|nr:AAA family ATPase [Alphaproteobacteria bacterium]